MSKFTSRMSMPVIVGAMALFAACSGDKNRADTALAADTSLNRDLALAGKDTAAQPQLTDVPKEPSTKAPATKTATKTKSTPTKTASGNTTTRPTGTVSRTGEIAAGTTLNLRSNSKVCTNTNK